MPQEPRSSSLDVARNGGRWNAQLCARAPARHCSHWAAEVVAKYAGAARPARNTGPARRAKVFSPKRSCQKRSVGSGVRKELVQFTVVEPPRNALAGWRRLCPRSAAPAFLVQRGIGPDSRWRKSLLLFERPFFHDDDLEACAGQQFGGDAGPAPEPTMATSQVILSGSGPCAPPRTFQPRCKPSRMGSGKLLMGCDVQRARGPG